MMRSRGGLLVAAVLGVLAAMAGLVRPSTSVTAMTPVAPGIVRVDPVAPPPVAPAAPPPARRPPPPSEPALSPASCHPAPEGVSWEATWRPWRAWPVAPPGAPDLAAQEAFDELVHHLHGSDELDEESLDHVEAFHRAAVEEGLLDVSPAEAAEDPWLGLLGAQALLVDGLGLWENDVDWEARRDLAWAVAEAHPDTLAGDLALYLIAEGHGDTLDADAVDAAAWLLEHSPDEALRAEVAGRLTMAPDELLDPALLAQAEDAAFGDTASSIAARAAQMCW